MAKKPKFEIGQWVRAKAVCAMVYTELKNRKSNRIVERTERIVEGQIVGVVWRPKGQYEPGWGKSGGLLGYEDYEPAYLKVKGTVKLWKIAVSMMNRPVEAMEQDIEPIDREGTVPMRLPVEFDEAHRRWLREESKTWPRDERGRWK